MCAPVVSTYTEYSDSLAVIKSRFRLAPPKQIFAQVSGRRIIPIRSPFGAIVEVQPGDTLYGIAGDLAEPGDMRAMVHRIQQLNSLPGGQITEGQKLAVPRG